MILDTSFVIDLLRKKENALKKLGELIKNGESFKITTLTIFELFTGLIRSTKYEKEKDEIENILKSQIIISLNEESAKKAGEIDGKLILEGNQLEPIDIMIGAIALQNKEKVLTKNIHDFSRIRNLEIESY